MTVKELKSSLGYTQIRRGVIGPDNKTKSRCSKSELCRFLNIHGVGNICHQTKQELKRSLDFQNLPENIKRGIRTKKAMCEAIARPKILVLRLTPDADHNNILTETSVPDTMTRLCHLEDPFDIEEILFDSAINLTASISSCLDNTLATIIIITHGSPDAITVGVNQFLDKHDLHNLNILPKLMEGAKVLMMSCETGFVVPDDMAQGVSARGSPNVTFHNTDIDNFANSLAKTIPGHHVLATGQAQFVGTWGMRRNNIGGLVCGTSQADPLPFVYSVEGQKLHHFLIDV